MIQFLIKSDIGLTLSHLRALHDALRKTFLKVTNI